MKIKPCHDQKTGKTNGNYYFKCPGCGKNHEVSTLTQWFANQILFTFNGNVNSPTLTPALQMKNGKYVTSNPDTDYGEGLICNSVVTDGNIRFLETSTHHLKGKTVELPELV